MTYAAPTAAELKARFPAFGAVSDDAVNAALTDAARMVDDTWLEADFKTGQMLYAAHQMTLDGLGSTSEGQFAGFKSISVGSLSLTVDNAVGGTKGSLNSTSFGTRFLDLARKNRGGAATVT